MASSDGKSTTNREKVFALCFLVFMFLCMTGMAAFNYFINPFGLFAGTRIEGVNSSKAIDNVRIFKTHQVGKERYSGIILGNSRTEGGIVPIPDLWGSEKIYNLSMPGATLPEIYRNLQHAHALNDLDTILIGLDFALFSAFEPRPPTFSEDYFVVTEAGTALGIGPRLRNRATALITVDAWNKSIATYKRSQQGRQPDYSENGSFPESHYAEHTQSYARFRKTFTAFEKTYFKKNGRWLNGPGAKYLTTDISTGISTTDIYRKILVFCHQHNIVLHQFISPTHVRMLYGRLKMGLGSAETDWKRSVALANRQVARDLSRPAYPLIDFSLINPKTTERLPLPDEEEAVAMRWFHDGVHYTREYGDLIQKTLFTGKPDALHSIDLVNVPLEELLKKQARLLKDWEDAQPSEAMEIHARLQELNTLDWQNHP